MASDFRRIIMEDNDGNFYLIPMIEEQEFDDWLHRQRTEEQQDGDFEKYNYYQINIEFLRS